MTGSPKSWQAAVAVGWGVGGIVLIVLTGLYRIVPIGFSAYQYDFSVWHWVLLWTWVPAMIWAEGYRGFHRSFSPMVAARAKYLAENPHPLHLALAPIFCLGFIHATPYRRRATTILTVGIVILVVLVRMLEQPWRGIIDLGVVMGLSTGLTSMGIWSVRAFRGEAFDWSPDVPEDVGPVEDPIDVGGATPPPDRRDGGVTNAGDSIRDNFGAREGESARRETRRARSV